MHRVSLLLFLLRIEDRRFFGLLLGVLFTVGPSAVCQAAKEPIEFERDIAPIFATRCLRCHSPNNKKGEISLATGDDLKENDLVVAGDPDSSHLLDVLTAVDGKRPEMPKDGEPLSDKQIGLIRRWIDEGANWPQDVTILEPSKADHTWWSLQPLSLPEQKGDLNSIDDFILAGLKANHLPMNPPADRRTLIRRVTYDLIGLPPTPEEVSDFVASSDPNAYEQLIDRLLESSHYGERWGRHWLDVVRFGESNGFERNVLINDLWPFRDYVIRSLNADIPFDQFIREHLAGDVIGKDDPDREIGSAFLVAGPYDDVGNQDPVQVAQIRANTIDEMIRATAEAFLGMTIGCARCHNHKFDPIQQRDYYALYATFAGVRHGSRVVATPKDRAAHAAKIKPLEAVRAELAAERDAVTQAIATRGEQNLATHEKTWTREPCNREGTEETFEPIDAKFIRLISEGQDANIDDTKRFGIDEFDVWSTGPNPRNVALASNGGRASGASRKIEDFPDAYGPQLAIDGKTGARFLATGGQLTIELAKRTKIQRVYFSSARGQTKSDQRKFVFVGEYRIEVSTDREFWKEVANSHDRKPVNDDHRKKRLFDLESNDAEKTELAQLGRQLAKVRRDVAAIPKLPTVWVGTRVAEDAAGPFHIFVGGSPQRKGETVVPASLGVLDKVVPAYALDPAAPESERRRALADWVVDKGNPLTPRVLANRLWHYHFGTGIVDTPSDFGYMGGRPTHPELLDWLAWQVLQHGWRLKPMHKLIMMSQTYRQSSAHHENSANIDVGSRLLWRFPPRRLSAEEIRDTILVVAGKLDTRGGGPGFRLYHFMQDNVSTYAPLDNHAPDTYRRAVYHQNARASVVDLMTDFDQPDCAFSTPRRAETTTPLQALTMLNHNFTLDMSRSLAARAAQDAGPRPSAQVQRVYLLCYGREAAADEIGPCIKLIREHSLETLCRVLLNTSELIFVR